MAKSKTTESYKGEFNYETMELVEETKEGVFVYDIKEALKRFDGKNLSFQLVEENPVQPKE
ncbi:YonK family protein [Paenibacillus sp. JSM ZJ436]|uniref:YonK family protein n=1 Tax=Paenibacillus sp. JSM ZJ436 TaxID=3376190 RepID=UPI003788729C